MPSEIFCWAHQGLRQNKRSFPESIVHIEINHEHKQYYWQQVVSIRVFLMSDDELTVDVSVRNLGKLKVHTVGDDRRLAISVLERDAKTEILIWATRVSTKDQRPTDQFVINYRVKADGKYGEAIAFDPHLDGVALSTNPLAHLSTTIFSKIGIGVRTLSSDLFHKERAAGNRIFTRTRLGSQPSTAEITTRSENPDGTTRDVSMAVIKTFTRQGAIDTMQRMAEEYFKQHKGAVKFFPPGTRPEARVLGFKSSKPKLPA